jgi:hypothetical protein
MIRVASKSARLKLIWGLEENSVEPRALRAHKGGLDGMLVRQETKRFQSIPMEIDFQYCQKQRRHDCGVVLSNREMIAATR